MGRVEFRLHCVPGHHLPNEFEALLAMKEIMALPHPNTPNTFCLDTRVHST